MTVWPEQRAVEVADGVVAILHGQGEAGVSNAGLVLAGDHSLVIDTMTFPEMARGILDELERRRAAARVVLNTHHHVDHIGGNSVFAAAGARLVAHPETVRVIEAGGRPTEVYDGFMPQFRGLFATLEIVVPEPALGDGDGLDLPEGVELPTFVPAHTPADVAVWLPGPRALFTGDLCFFGVVPLALQGLLSTWIDALDALLALGPAVVVPGHGPVGGPAEVAVVRDHLAALLDAGRRAVADGVTLDDAVGAFDAGPVGEWLEGERTLVNLDRAMQEARGEIAAGDLDAIPTSFPRLLH